MSYEVSCSYTCDMCGEKFVDGYQVAYSYIKTIKNSSTFSEESGYLEGHGYRPQNEYCTSCFEKLLQKMDEEKDGKFYWIS